MGTVSISIKNLCCGVSKTLRYHRIQSASKKLVLFVTQPRLPQIVLGLHWSRQNNASEEVRFSNIDGAQFFFSVLNDADDWSWLENLNLFLSFSFACSIFSLPLHFPCFPSCNNLGSNLSSLKNGSLKMGFQNRLS